MKIAQMIDLLYWGGAQKLLVTFAGVARRRGYDLTVISLRSDSNTTLIERALREQGARVVTFAAPRLLNARRIRELRAFLRRERFAVVHTHLAYANILGALAGRLTRTPVVATLHLASTDPLLRREVHYVERWALRYLARRVVAVGQTVAEGHRERLGGRPISVIPNAVDPAGQLAPEERALLRAELAGDPARPLLISVGRLVHYKGFEDLLEAFAMLRARHPQAALAIAGGGELEQPLAQRIDALGLRGHARLLGVRDDVPRLLAASDLYVSASHLEGLPIATLEAMAAGLPVVATDTGDVAHVVVQGTGTVVPARQPRLLAEALAALLDQPGQLRELGSAARAHVERNYSPEAWVDRLVEVYMDVVGRRSPARERL